MAENLLELRMSPLKQGRNPLKACLKLVTRKAKSNIWWQTQWKTRKAKTTTDGKHNDDGGTAQARKLQNGKMPKSNPKSMEPFYL